MADKKEEDGFFVSLYKKAKSKFIQEVQQFNDMGGWSNAGEYVAQNATSLGVKTAKGLGADKLAEKIEGKREKVVNAGKAVDAKIAEEVQQFNDMGGWEHAGEYVTQNATSLGVKTAKGLGADKLAEKIEGKRETIVNAGKNFDKDNQRYIDSGGVKRTVDETLTSVDNVTTAFFTMLDGDIPDDIQIFGINSPESDGNDLTRDIKNTKGTLQSSPKAVAHNRRIDMRSASHLAHKQKTESMTKKETPKITQENKVIIPSRNIEREI